MLETGLICISCNKNNYLKDINLDTHICFDCEKINEDIVLSKQQKLQELFFLKDKSVSRCRCSRYFIVRPEMKDCCVRCKIEEELRFYGEDVCQKLESQEEMEESGITGDGEQKSRLSVKKDMNEIGVRDNTIKSTTEKTKSETTKDQRETTSLTKSKELSRGLSGPEKIRRSKMQHSESTIDKTESNNLKKFTEGEGEITQQSDLSQLSTELNVEKLGSMRLLNSSANHLMDLAKSVATVTRDDEGEVLRTPAQSQVEVAIKCFEELRNTMKTKLDYLKFSRDVIKDFKD